MPKRSKAPTLTVLLLLLSSLLAAHAQALACAVERVGVRTTGTAAGNWTLALYLNWRCASCWIDTVPRVELAAEMRTAAVLHGDYDLLATTNWTRFQSALYLQLVRNAMEREPLGRVLFIPSQDLFWEFVSLAGLADPGEAPAHLLWRLHLDQGSYLEYRPDSIVTSVRKGPEPTLAVNVHIRWPDRTDGTEKYSFIDTLSVLPGRDPVRSAPRAELKVTNHQEISFRMLDFGDMVVYDKVEGASGRPLSGVLGALFKVIGEGDVKWARAGISEDGIQVVRAQAKKLFTKTATVTVLRDGVAEKDTPDDRPDLAAIAARLKEDLEMEYYPYGCW